MKIEQALRPFENKEKHLEIQQQVKILLKRIEQLNVGSN